MLLKNKKERARMYLATACSVGVFIYILEVVKSCARI